MAFGRSKGRSDGSRRDPRTASGRGSQRIARGGEATHGRGARAASRHNATSVAALSRANAASMYARRRKRQRRRRIVRGILLTLLGLLAACGVAIGLYAFNLNSQLTGNVDDATREVLSDTVNDEPFYALLLGTDRNQERDDSGDFGVYRSDTIILARVDPGEQVVTLVSIPRDTMVEIEGYGVDKINAAYAYGGASLAITTVEDFAGVDISHYAEVNMDGFAAVVDQVGGVTVDLPVAVSDPVIDLELPAGEQTLDGATAALLARSRHAYDDYGGGDYFRAANQRMLIGEVVNELLSSDPVTIANTISTIAGYVTTDMGVADLVSLAGMFAGFDVNTSFYSGMCPVVSQYVNGMWQDTVDQTAWEEMMVRVDSGLPPYSDESQDFTSGVAGSLGVSSGASEGDGSSVEPDFSGNVIVLNAAGVSGIAGNVANELSAAGYSTYADNAANLSDATVIYYNGEGGAAKAAGVQQTLGGSYQVAQNDGTYDTTVDVVVVIGSDYA